MSFGSQISAAVLSARQLGRRYLVALCLIATLAVVSQVLIQLQMADQVADARILSIAERQRMLSHKIAKLSFYVANAASADAASSYRLELEETLSLWQRSHLGLLRGDNEIGLSGNNDREVVALFAAVQADHDEIAAAAREILSPGASSQILERNLRKIAEHDAKFLQGMDEIVRHYEREARAEAALTKWLALALLAIVLVVLMLVDAFVFAPAIRRIERDAQVLAENEARLKETLDTAHDGLITIDARGAVREFNPVAEAMFGWNKEEIIGRQMVDILFPNRLRQAHRQGLAQFIQTRKSRLLNRQLEISALRRDGSAFPVEMTITMLRQDEQEFFSARIRDISERRRAEADLQVAAIAFESQEGMLITDAKRKILRVNKAFTGITGYSAEEALGQTPRLLKSDRHDQAFYGALNEHLQRRGSWKGEIWNRRKNGEVYPGRLTITAVKDVSETVSHYVGTLTDITARKAAEAKINSLAFYDPLTGLPNRRLLLDRLHHAMAIGARSETYGALMLIDLDNFKTINDTSGHDIGDMLLSQVALRLSTCIREGDTVARLGGDEFVVMLEHLSKDPHEAAAQTESVVEKILSTLNQPYQLERYEHHNSPSIGIILFSGLQCPIDELLKRADLAMYQAKAAGRNTQRFFDPEMQTAVTRRALLEDGLREALLKNQFLVYYQAQVDGRGGLTGAEALVRWQHPQRGLVSPVEFIPLAEETGVILPLGKWVLEIACSQLAVWAERPEMAHLTIAVNVSARQLHHRDFVDQVLSALERTGADPNRLKLELTESLLVTDVDHVIEKMSALKSRGVGFALDDFGTGFSSLSYLKRLPLEQLKIDRGFIRDILTDSNDAAIAKMVGALAESLGLTVLAEGVENVEQANFLAGQGCQAFQGYYYGHPLPLAEFEQFAGRPKVALEETLFRELVRDVLGDPAP